MEMLHRADHAVVIAGDENTRSYTMDAALRPPSSRAFRLAGFCSPTTSTQQAHDPGHRLANEVCTLIIALMRGGRRREQRLLEEKAIVLVDDSVVKSGATDVEFVDYIRRFVRDGRVVVSGGCAGPRSRWEPDYDYLYPSENKDTGTKSTDTGDRLFNMIDLA
ncbi:hypothetical protein BO78DRAFT_412989 [Aspergillus sclerotiicarbonarius CBS 121057]|uniref:Uncharacterized protein n=1 Tax=Aspergillus sclerotiicarbonarius (strain CBS 121057 / IBT 28362) TaxID=1448318 RepID=A0A319ENT4_ASPSB|nr:hypothetical protein BO78DRAFT_412989 [Aspergillus sclerotiicarbonarius CBS 121057]